MEYNVNRWSEKHNFIINGASYIGNPRENTAMFITNKVSGLLSNLENVKHCLVFAEKGINVPDSILQDNCFIFTSNPQRDYAVLMEEFSSMREKKDLNRKYRMTEGGYYVGENVKIGKNCNIEPMCLIGHDVVIGNNAHILAGTIIKNALIGDDFFANENAVIGANGFTMAEDDCYNKFRIPTLGKVLIGNNVEVGAHDNISCGSGGNTVIEDNVKLDTQVHIGHDVHLGKNIEITAGVIVGGFVKIEEGAFIGINATIRNRIKIGKESRVSMGAVVTKNVDKKTTVTGNFAVEHHRFLKELNERNMKEKELQNMIGGYLCK